MAAIEAVHSCLPRRPLRWGQPPLVDSERRSVRAATTGETTKLHLKCILTLPPERRSTLMLPGDLEPLYVPHTQRTSSVVGGKRKFRSLSAYEDASARMEKVEAGKRWAAADPRSIEPWSGAWDQFFPCIKEFRWKNVTTLESHGREVRVGVRCERCPLTLRKHEYDEEPTTGGLLQPSCLFTFDGHAVRTQCLVCKTTKLFGGSNFSRHAEFHRAIIKAAQQEKQ